MISPGAAMLSIAMMLHPAHKPVTFEIASANPAGERTLLAKNDVSFSNLPTIWAGPPARHVVDAATRDDDRSGNDR